MTIILADNDHNLVCRCAVLASWRRRLLRLAVALVTANLTPSNLVREDMRALSRRTLNPIVLATAPAIGGLTGLVAYRIG